MTYYDKYQCINCPVDKYCGTVVSAIKLCHSLEDNKEPAHILTLSEAASNIKEEEFIEEKITMWDNVTD